MATQEYDFRLAEDADADKEERIAAAQRYYQVNRQVATVMIETGYSKGTANRIIGDRRRAEGRAIEAEKKSKVKAAA